MRNVASFTFADRLTTDNTINCDYF